MNFFLEILLIRLVSDKVFTVSDKMTNHLKTNWKI